MGRQERRGIYTLSVCLHDRRWDGESGRDALVSRWRKRGTRAGGRRSTEASRGAGGWAGPEASALVLPCVSVHLLRTYDFCLACYAGDPEDTVHLASSMSDDAVSPSSDAWRMSHPGYPQPCPRTEYIFPSVVTLLLLLLLLLLLCPATSPPLLFDMTDYQDTLLPSTSDIEQRPHVTAPHPVIMLTKPARHVHALDPIRMCN
ncbi:hypothetical protein M432DRAFT_140675 [Thermoascus aurantiacus ATCC 26904]